MQPTNFPAEFASDDYCYLLTTGRKTGQRRETEIWFAMGPGERSNRLYVLAGSGENAYWVKNLRANPLLNIRMRELEIPAQIFDIGTEEEEALARDLLVEKYQPGYSKDLSEWKRTALPLAFEVQPSLPG
jgi:deazaflavin-dependent oxidoreductase (nitroreductase family)